ncbi:MAG: hypothetical protein AM1032_000401 [Mycoplasmataceae bacterium]|nr:MAG: hypothetical protein AM1032_000401 [Mycoplasmataceae bacterium]
MIFAIAFLSITLIKLMNFDFKELNKDAKEIKIKDISKKILDFEEKNKNKEDEESYGIIKFEFESTHYVTIKYMN